MGSFLPSLLFFCLFSSSIASGVQVSTLPREVGIVPLKLPAFAEVYRSHDESLPYADQFTLYISTFNPFAFLKTDAVYYVKSPGRYLNNLTSLPVAMLSKTAFWPNNPDLLPAGVVPGYEGVVQTSGFLVPTKTKGKLQLFNMNADEPGQTVLNIASADEKDYAYHRVLWKDMDGDGDLDAVTARFHNANKEQSFAWLENPGLPVDGWKQHEIYKNGPDVSFRNVQLKSNSVDMDCFVTAELWHERAAVYCVPINAQGGWNNPDNIKTRVIDDSVGQAFDLLIEDFDNDGRVDFLLTAFNNSRDAMTGNVFIYQIPDDLFEGEWVRHVIADQFVPSKGNNKMSPGTPKSFYPSKAYAEEKVDGRPHRSWIALSGDDDGHFYVLRPTTDHQGDWSPYEKAVLLATGAETAGTMAVGDVDGDGYTDMFLSGYSANKVFVYTYKP